MTELVQPAQGILRPGDRPMQSMAPFAPYPPPATPPRFTAGRDAFSRPQISDPRARGGARPDDAFELGANSGYAPIAQAAEDGGYFAGTTAGNDDILNLVSNVVPYGNGAFRGHLQAQPSGYGPSFPPEPAAPPSNRGYRQPPATSDYDYEASLAMLETLSLQNRIASLSGTNNSGYGSGSPPPPVRGYPGYGERNPILPPDRYAPQPPPQPDLERIRQKLSPEEWSLLLRNNPSFDAFDRRPDFDRRSRSTTINSYPYGYYGYGYDRSVSRDGMPRGPDAKNKKAELYKTELCRSWEETGRCRYGVKCQFAHGEAELRPVERHIKYKTELCKTFWETGWCPYGRRCCFIHTQRDLIKKQDDLEKNLIVLRKPERRRDDDFDDWETEWYDERFRTRSYGAEPLYRTGSAGYAKPPRFQGVDDRYDDRALEYPADRPSEFGRRPLVDYPRANEFAIDPFAQTPPATKELDVRAQPFVPLGAIGSEKAQAGPLQSKANYGAIGTGHGLGIDDHDHGFGGRHDDWPLQPKEPTPPFGGASEYSHQPLSPFSNQPHLKLNQPSPIRSEASPYADLLASVSPAINGRSNNNEPDAFTFGNEWAREPTRSTETLFDPDKTFSYEELSGLGKEVDGYDELGAGFGNEEEHAGDDTFAEHHEEEEHGFDFGKLAWDAHEAEAEEEAEHHESEPRSPVSHSGSAKQPETASRHLGAASGSGWEAYY